MSHDKKPDEFGLFVSWMGVIFGVAGMLFTAATGGWVTFVLLAACVAVLLRGIIKATEWE